MTREAGEPISLSFQGQKEEESRIYDVTEGLRSEHTKKAYANAFNLDVTIKNRDSCLTQSILLWSPRSLITSHNSRM